MRAVVFPRSNSVPKLLRNLACHVAMYEWSSAAKGVQVLAEVLCPSKIDLRLAIGFLILESIENRPGSLLLRLFYSFPGLIVRLLIF